MDFEKYIEQNRKKLDQVEQVPSDIIWHGIQDGVGRKTRIIRLQRIAIAATIVIAIGAISILKLNQPKDQFNYLTDNTEFTTQESRYYQMASDKKAEINYSELDQDTYGEIIEELEMLDSMYMDMKKEIMENPDAERAINTAIKFHERRLHILELLEKEIENQKRIEENESLINI